jgi:fumarate hydratase class II
MMAYNVLQSMQLLGDAASAFTDNCVVGLEADEDADRQADARIA